MFECYHAYAIEENNFLIDGYMFTLSYIGLIII